MPRAPLGLFALLLTGAVMSASATDGGPVGTSPTPSHPIPFIPVHLDRLPLPAGLMPDQPTFTADGRWILFQDRLGGGLWLMSADRGAPRCLTCPLADRPAAIGVVQPFADGRRVLLADAAEPAGGAWVLECAVDLGDCTEPRLLPVDLAAATSGRLLARRDWHLAPDDGHLGWTELRRDGTALVLARLVRQADGYAVVEPRVINPPGPSGPEDTDPDRREDFLQSWQLGAFADGGAAVLVVGARGGNRDLLKLDLATGATSRLTAHPDWDAAGALSPDGQLLAIASWRTRDRLPATAWLPGLRNFIGLPLDEALAGLYRSTWEGRQCDLSAWLLPADGDQHGRLTGQPLAVYDGLQTPGDNGAGQAIWSPDGTRVLLAEALRTPVPPGLPAGVTRTGLAPGRLVIARLERAPAAPLPVVSSVPGPWAPALADWRGPLAAAGTVTVPGRQGGSATIETDGDLLTGRVTATFADYSDDGDTVLNGTMSAEMADDGTRILLDLSSIGASANNGTGALTADYRVDRGAGAPPAGGGSWVASRDGRPAPPLPAPVACPDRLPRPAPLTVSVRRTGGADVIAVTAAIGDDRRPVQNALVIAPGGPYRTDAHGEARLPLSPAGTRTVTVLAGDTFLPAHATQ